MAAAPFRHPKLSATYAVDGSRDFAQEMKEIARRSGRSNVLDAKADYTHVLEASPQPVPQLTEAGEMPPTRPSFTRRNLAMPARKRPQSRQSYLMSFWLHC
jgi:hypothetical protein